jgi:hypothetical protein
LTQRNIKKVEDRSVLFRAPSSGQFEDLIFVDCDSKIFYLCFQLEDMVKVVVSVDASGVRAPSFPYVIASDLGAFSWIRHLIVPDTKAVYNIL